MELKRELKDAQNGPQGSSKGNLREPKRELEGAQMGAQELFKRGHGSSSRKLIDHQQANLESYYIRFAAIICIL